MKSEINVLAQVYTAGCRGLVDALSFHRCLVLLVRSSKLRVRVVQCLLLNGIIFLGSIFLFARMISPLLMFILGQVVGTDSLSLPLIQSWIEWTYFVLWIAPVYLLSFILNAFWYQDIATESIEVYPKTASHSSKATGTSSITTEIAEVIHRSIFNACFFIYLALLRRWWFIYLVNLAWLISYTSFEYRWNHGGLTFEAKVQLVERNWIYYLFFGLPLAGIAVQFPSLIENGLISVAFPFILMMSSTSARVSPIAINTSRSWFTRVSLSWLERLRILIAPKILSQVFVLLISR